MKKAERHVLVLAVVVVAVIAVQMAFTMATGRVRSARLARIKRPASMAVHDQLVAQMIEKDDRQTVPGPDSRNMSEPPDFPSEAAETVAAYAQYFTDIDEIWGGRALPEETLDILSKSPESWTDAERATVEQAVSERKSLVRQLRELAARGGPVYPLDYSKGFQMELPHLSKMRAGAQLLKADAIISSMNGDYSEAVTDIIAGMQLGDALAGEPILISQLVRVAVYGIMIEGIRQSFHGGDLSAEQMSRLEDQLDQADNRHAFAESFLGEQITMAQIFSQIRAVEHTDMLTSSVALFQDTSTLGQLTKPIRPLLARSYAPVMQPWLNLDESTLTDLLDRTATVAELPYYQARPQLEITEQQVENMPRSRTWSRMMMPALTRSCEAQARHEARLDLVQMGLVLEQYQADHGSYPDTLDAIAPQMGWSMPVDPFSGKPYHYRRTGDTFRLYSVGANLTDDGGIINPQYSWSGDLVWRGRPE